ncbi:shikimate kinase [Mycobacteriaceae bacterium 1482268.1]|nr:shikimate kinase [Mycobacteriaceae bacterium 1482268.1]
MAPKAVLIGLPGSGKSTIGRRLAKSLGVALLDTDAAIEKTTGRTIPDIFANDGEAEFRRIEEEVIRDALQSHDGVLSLGGGAITTAGVREALSGHTVVYLEISAAEGIRRTGGTTVRPLLAGGDRAEKFKALMSQRVPLYRKAATLRVNTNRRNPGAVVRYIASRLENPQANDAPPKPKPRRRRRTTWRRTPVSLAPSTSEPSTPASPAELARRAEARHD